MPTSNPHTINDDIRELAYIQRQIADLLNAAGAKVRELEIAMSNKANELERLVTRGSNRNAAAEIAAAFIETASIPASSTAA